MLAIEAPFPQFFDKDGSPLDDGYLYFGTANLNPETNPITVYWDLAGTQPAAQPIRTLNGYAARSGSAAVVYVPGDYSLTVRDKSGRLLPSVASSASTANSASILATINNYISSVASSIGSSLIGFIAAGGAAILRTVQSKLRDTISVMDFGAKGDGVTDDTAAFQAALDYVRGIGGGRVEVPAPASFYLVSASINVGVSFTAAVPSATYANIELIGKGAPVIKSNNNTKPIINFGGNLCRLENLNLQYTAKPANTFVDAVAIRAYNVAYSTIERIYAFNVFGAMDMYQGNVAATGANFFFSNTTRDIVAQQYSGWGIKMLPFVGGNSGNLWLNIYLNANNNTGAAGSSATLGGFWLQTCQNEVIDLLNIEWQRNAGSAIVLNQCHNPKFGAIHFEGLYPTTAFSPLIDIIGGDGSCPTFTSITITGCDWTGYAAINQGALFRLDSLGTRAIAQSVTSYNNTNPTFMSALFNAGATCYGSTLEVNTVTDLDLSLSSDAYSPRISAGTATANVEYPMQRWNLNITKHSALAVDNVGGTLVSANPMPGLVTSPAYDGMGLWTAASNQFVVKQSGNYLVQVLIPTAASPIIQVKQNGVVVAGLTPPTAGGHDTVVVPLVRGDIIKLTLASGSYTRTGVSFGISLAS